MAKNNGKSNGKVVSREQLEEQARLRKQVGETLKHEDTMKFLAVLYEFAPYVFVDLTGTERVDIGDEWVADYPVGHQRVKDWLFAFFLKVFHYPMPRATLDATLAFLRVEAQNVGVQTPPETQLKQWAELLDDDSIFIAVRAWMQEVKKAGEKKTVWAREGYSDLMATGEQYSENMDLWPEDSAALSRRLKQAKEQLLGFGISFDVEHTRKGNKWVFKRVTEGTSEDFIEKDANKKEGKKKLQEDWDLPGEAYA